MTITINHRKFDIPRWDIELYRGDTRFIDIAIVTEQGIADLSGCEFRLQIRPDDGEPISPEIKMRGNIVHLHFAAGLTRELDWQRGKYDLQMQRGDIVTTILHGKVRLKEDITR